VSSPRSDPPPISGRRLTGLLGRWAGARRLDAQQAATIRQRVLAASADLGFDWWWRLLDPENGSVFRERSARPASLMPFDATVDLAPFGLGRGTFAAWSPDESAWPLDEAEYQPYLRLT
jgi:hypothetical protein